jgi:tripartite-type tricarboxylate transporter receptor subunit TctC
LPHIKSGALNAIAITSPDRFRLLPDTPTFRELGQQEFTTLVWFGLLTQAATSKNVIQDMIAAGIKAQQEQSVREPLLAQGYDLPDESGDAFAKSIAEGNAHWASLVKLTGFKASR